MNGVGFGGLLELAVALASGFMLCRIEPVRIHLRRQLPPVPYGARVFLPEAEAAAERSLGTTQNCFILAVALCPAKRRFAFSPMGSHARLAAEIPDIFLPLARNENSGMTMLFFSLGVALVSGGVLTTGVVIRRRAVSGETARGVGFCFFLEVAPVSEGDSFTRTGEDGTRGFGFLWGLLRCWGGGLFHTRGAWERHRIVSSSPSRCVLRSGASHSFQWGVMPALRRRFRIFSFRLREMKIPE